MFSYYRSVLISCLSSLPLPGMRSTFLVLLSSPLRPVRYLISVVAPFPPPSPLKYSSIRIGGRHMNFDHGLILPHLNWLNYKTYRNRAEGMGVRPVGVRPVSVRCYLTSRMRA